LNLYSSAGYNFVRTEYAIITCSRFPSDELISMKNEAEIAQSVQRPGYGLEIFHFTTAPRTALGPPTSLLSNG